MRKYLADMDQILVPIERSNVESGDVSETVAVFETFAASPAMAMSVLGHVAISVSGYDDDPRRLLPLKSESGAPIRRGALSH